jgi:hypothetical protein
VPAAAAETYASTSPRTAEVLVVVNHLPCGVAARRSIHTAVEFCATLRIAAPLVSARALTWAT